MNYFLADAEKNHDRQMRNQMVSTYKNFRRKILNSFLIFKLEKQ